MTFSYVNSSGDVVHNSSGISSYILSPVVLSMSTGHSGEGSSGVGLYSAYGEMPAKIEKITLVHVFKTAYLMNI